MPKEMLSRPNWSPARLHARAFVFNDDGTFVYEHDGSETIEDTFEYKLVDVNGGESPVATVTLTINPVNDAPIAVDDNYVVDEGALLTADDADGSVPGTNDDGVLVNDTDAEFEVLTAELIDVPPAPCRHVCAERRRDVRLSARWQRDAQ